MRALVTVLWIGVGTGLGIMMDETARSFYEHRPLIPGLITGFGIFVFFMGFLGLASEDSD